ncbi:hypothetical protein CDV36_012565 [Fusarium kuroshium]|uniref:Uncharacterized protein n=1 Tax=Fusarium kuroshium TaxID=2010991 RepID=A0A3M2RRC5_9HYPO|nr:hypothetical protein CDV36_012565 [Fusarium kuroshium]
MSTINVERPYGVENMMSILLDNFDLQSLAMTREDEEGPPQTACRRRYPAPIMASRLPALLEELCQRYDFGLVLVFTYVDDCAAPRGSRDPEPWGFALFGPCFLFGNRFPGTGHWAWRAAEAGRLDGAACPGGATTVPDRTSSELPAASDVMGVVKLACRLSTPFT